MTGPRHATPPGTVCVCSTCSPPPRVKRARIFRSRPGMWVVIDTNYATYSADTWRKAMDLVSPPKRSDLGL